MKRELLFCGKRQDNGEWVYGDLIHYGKYMSIRCSVSKNGDIPKYIEFIVIPETVRQFTGFYDKNSKKIFEDDVLLCNGIKYLLKSDIGKAYELHQIGIDTRNGDGVFFLFNHFNIVEVIGNIQDNPELVK